MTRAILALCATILLLAACTPQQQPVEVGENEVPLQPSLPEPSEQTPPVQPEPSGTPTPGEPDRTAFDFPTDVQEIVNNAETRTGNGISYTYVKIENNLPSRDVASEALVYQKGSTIKLVTNDDQALLFVNQKREDFFTVVILDVEAQTAEAHCTVVKSCQGNTGTRSVSYGDVVFPTPLYWLESMSDPTKTGQATMDGRSVYNLAATVEDRPVTISVDRYSGVPVKVVDGKTVYEYRSFALGVTDEQLKV